MSNTKIKNEFCSRCDGTGKLEYGKGGDHPGSPDKCFHCDGYGYRILYRDKNGYEFSSTVDDWKWRKDEE